MEIAKIALSSKEVHGEKLLQITNIFESHSSRIVLIEADPENIMCLYVITDEMKLLKLIDDGEGKAVV